MSSTRARSTPPPGARRSTPPSPTRLEQPLELEVAQNAVATAPIRTAVPSSRPSIALRRSLTVSARCSKPCRLVAMSNSKAWRAS
ncbi:hypothetical protein GTW59_05495 [Streptomyces sp. SID89]|nr:hypothetical protein [Streptomyces sp. SID89]